MSAVVEFSSGLLGVLRTANSRLHMLRYDVQSAGAPNRARGSKSEWTSKRANGSLGVRDSDSQEGNGEAINFTDKEECIACSLAHMHIPGDILSQKVEDFVREVASFSWQWMQCRTDLLFKRQARVSPHAQDKIPCKMSVQF